MSRSAIAASMVLGTVPTLVPCLGLAEMLGFGAQRGLLLPLIQC